ncbi:PP2C family serine/threonine-protein phosphatase [Candidatus Protochlamydia phocaeensis]|uniref:PP2C family serine/threonine-protein phosphatase n=1 Tax=Candidatus Protochlamydia phocaeensis TaxID=1414722 RepID=UPI00083914CB|nr:PP2C family serine/threonine-protein phosphatase [Candidatus Protochlamydia phocaeensis]
MIWPINHETEYVFSLPSRRPLLRQEINPSEQPALIRGQEGGWGNKITVVVDALSSILSPLISLICQIAKIIFYPFTWSYNKALSLFDRSPRENTPLSQTSRILTPPPVVPSLDRNASHPIENLSPLPPISLPVSEINVQASSESNSSIKEGGEDAAGTPKSPEERMLRNLRKAIKEHREECVIDEENMFSSVKTHLSFRLFECEEKGSIREDMEDAHFFIPVENGYLMGLFDGHGDKGKIARFAALQCKRLFPLEKAKSPDDLRAVFTHIINQIHQQVIQKSFPGGSTAVIGFIDKKTNRIYTGTLGDSEAKIFRKTEKGWQVIPLSCVRDWSSKKDAARAARALNKDLIAEVWPRMRAKFLRFPTLNEGVNVSRAIGDQEYNEWNGKPGVIQKQKTTMAELKKGDLLIMACDGLWDYAKDRELIDQVLNPWLEDQELDLAQLIVDYALNKKNSTDNVSVIALYTEKN